MTDTPAVTRPGVSSFGDMRALSPVQLRRLIARTLRVALEGGPASTQLVDRWADAEASDAAWLAAITWDGCGAALGWALQALELGTVAPPTLEVHVTDAFDEARTQCVQLSSDLLRLGAELEALRIPAVALKGSALLAANVAPALGVRWMSDIDILVAEQHVEQAAWILESLDYTRGASRDPAGPEVFRPYHETFVSPEGSIVELHWRLGPARWGKATAADAWFERALPSSMPGLLVPCGTDLFWHALLHDARNHAWSTGSLRSALDLALIARTPGFTVAEILGRISDDERGEPLLEAIADAAHLSPVLASEVEPSQEPRYLRLARWRDYWGRRQWETHRIAEAIAWGATLDRVRRHGGWRGVIDRAVLVIPEAAPGTGLGREIWRAMLNVRHGAFVAALTAGHFITIPGRAETARRLSPPRTD
jgi:hypothetical protein